MRVREELFSEFSSNNHTGSYITVLIEGEGSVTTAVREVEKELDTDKPAGRRDNTSLQGTATTTAAAREVEEDVTMRAVLLQLIDTIISVFNLAFLAATEAAAAP
ncbi:hypothetical protein BDBG_02662 [Blastomyces gilchristii SLH14081]|uniref:Uncharacterized protein n=1 Tax=Blastomyces gilchristii (strain SLH14081) TaxID=559298 RepID=A0A179UFE9_BLAGS|nr:uncharacterized protein BDBG_02662 [Blastomyces gilchristii SLH14081]OAT06473.1 hypothetical protein BDBG_02662 [Blastomyces gilchristii SLH14081]